MTEPNTQPLSVEVRRVPYPGTEGAPTDSPFDMSHMVSISKVIADLKEIHERWGDTCVYIRRGGVSWGAVALNRRDDDKKYGLFDLQATHDRAMEERLGQVNRLVEDLNSERELRWKAEATIADLQGKLANERAEWKTQLDRAEAAESALRERDWKDISTAPKDGTPICAARMVRYMPYKPDGRRQMGTRGRWQEWNGCGWHDCEAPEKYLPYAPQETGKETQK